MTKLNDQSKIIFKMNAVERKTEFKTPIQRLGELINACDKIEWENTTYEDFKILKLLVAEIKSENKERFLNLVSE